jgi:hypothetical protein
MGIQCGHGNRVENPFLVGQALSLSDWRHACPIVVPSFLSASFRTAGLPVRLAACLSDRRPANLLHIVGQRVWMSDSRPYCPKKLFGTAWSAKVLSGPREPLRDRASTPPRAGTGPLFVRWDGFSWVWGVMSSDFFLATAVVNVATQRCAIARCANVRGASILQRSCIRTSQPRVGREKLVSE